MSDNTINELPNNWEWTELGNVITKIIGGGTPSKIKSEYWCGDIPWFTVKDMRTRRPTDAKDHISEKAVEESSTNIIPEDTVIIATRIGLGKVIRVPYKAAINQDLKAVIVPSEIDKGYLEYWFVSKTYYLESIGSGTTVKGIRLEQVRDLKFPLAPLEQQKQIVAKIEQLFSHIDAGVEALNTAKQRLKQYRQSVLKAAVTGELTKEWREENKSKLEPASQLLERILQTRRQKWEEQQLEQFKAKGKLPKNDKWKEKYKEPLSYTFDGDLPDIPNTWTWASPEQIASTDQYSLAIGPFGSNLKVSDYRDEGVPLVFVRNIRKHYYGKDNAKYVTEQKAIELKAHSISGGDVLITKMGEPPGDASIFPMAANDAIITADCIKWRLNSLFEYPALYVHIINSQLIRDQIIKRTKGVAQKKISLGTFKSIAFPLPPFREQNEILKRVELKLSGLDHLLNEVDLQLLKAKKTKQSILASAFSGKLTITSKGAEL